MFFWKNFSSECLEVSPECVGWLILDTSWRFFEEDFRELRSKGFEFLESFRDRDFGGFSGKVSVEPS
jgi:hypothetical protein